jgi:hypothetical protein
MCMKRPVLPRQGSEPKWRSLHPHRLSQGARAGRLNCAYICDEKSPLKAQRGQRGLGLANSLTGDQVSD